MATKNDDNPIVEIMNLFKRLGNDDLLEKIEIISARVEQLDQMATTLEHIESRLRQMEHSRPCEPEVLDVDQTAHLLNVTADHLRHMTNKRKIPYYKQNRKLYFKLSEINAWKLANRYPTSDEIDSVAVTHVTINPRPRRRGGRSKGVTK